jgi:hypothetical protein
LSMAIISLAGGPAMCHRRAGNRYPFHLLNYLTRKCRIAVVE